jgi:Lon-like ATP-dependent protease
VIFPEGNRRDWEELSEEVKAGLEPHFVGEYRQIYELAFEMPVTDAAATAA